MTILARDIMTTPVVTIGPDTPVLEVAALLLQRRFSGVPIVLGDQVIGIVSEGDLLHRREIGTEHAHPRRSWWQRLVDGDPLPAEYVKSHGRRAADVMTRHVVTVADDAEVAQIALMFEDRGIKRVPVLRAGRLAGIVTRADLIRAIVLLTARDEPDADPSDASIRERLLAELSAQPWWRPDWSAVHVDAGVVHFRGMLRDEDERRAARVAAENVPGVRGVHDDRIAVPDWTPMM